MLLTLLSHNNLMLEVNLKMKLEELLLRLLWLDLNNKNNNKIHSRIVLREILINYLINTIRFNRMNIKNNNNRLRKDTINLMKKINREMIYCDYYFKIISFYYKKYINITFYSINTYIRLK